MSYAELHAKTNFSFLEGASHPDEMVCRAAELEYAALAITDRNSLAGVVRAHVAAKELGLKLLVGAEITPEDAPPVVLLPTDRAAYGRLASLITRGRRRAVRPFSSLLNPVVGRCRPQAASCRSGGWGKLRSATSKIRRERFNSTSSAMSSGSRTTPSGSWISEISSDLKAECSKPRAGRFLTDSQPPVASGQPKRPRAIESQACTPSGCSSGLLASYIGS